MSDDIIAKLADLHRQATEERSHYYTATVIKEAVAEIGVLRARVAELEAELRPWRADRRLKGPS